MNPNATLRRIEGSLEEHAWDEAIQACKDLKDWLDYSGFPPDWDRYGEATRFYRVLFGECCICGESEDYHPTQGGR